MTQGIPQHFTCAALLLTFTLGLALAPARSAASSLEQSAPEQATQGQDQGQAAPDAPSITLTLQLTASEVAVATLSGVQAQISGNPGINVLDPAQNPDASCFFQPGFTYQDVTLRLEVSDEAAWLTCAAARRSGQPIDASALPPAAASPEQVNAS